MLERAEKGAVTSYVTTRIATTVLIANLTQNEGPKFHRQLAINNLSGGLTVVSDVSPAPLVSKRF